MGETKMDDIIYEELSLVEEIKYALDVHKIEDLDSEEDLDAGLLEIDELSKKFRKCHAKLHLEMKEKYQDTYPNKDKILENLLTYLKSAKRKRSELQKFTKVEKLKSNFRLLEKKIALLRKSYHLESLISLHEINDFIDKGGQLLDDYYEAFSELKGAIFENDCDDNFAPLFDKTSEELNEDIEIVCVLFKASG